MSLTTVFDDIVTKVESLYPSHKRLGDSHDIEENPSTLLAQGWALRVGPGGGDGELFISNISTGEVDFVLTFTRGSKTRELDAVAKANVEKLLLEDFQILLNDIHENSLGFTDEIISSLTFDGIDKISITDGKALQLACNFTVTNFTAL